MSDWWKEVMSDRSYDAMQAQFAAAEGAVEETEEPIAVMVFLGPQALTQALVRLAELDDPKLEDVGVALAKEFWDSSEVAVNHDTIAAATRFVSNPPEWDEDEDEEED